MSEPTDKEATGDYSRKYRIVMNVFECGFVLGMIAKLEPADAERISSVYAQLVEVWKDTYGEPNAARRA